MRFALDLYGAVLQWGNYLLGVLLGSEGVVIDLMGLFIHAHTALLVDGVVADHAVLLLLLNHRKFVGMLR